MANVGRPTKYNEDYPKKAYKLCLLGATDEKLADFFEVDVSTVNKWKLDYPEFSESIKNGKDIADTNVVRSLYERATGYEHPEEKVFCSDGVIVTHDTKKHYPPDTTAMIFWLKNRQPKLWRDKTEQDINVSGGLADELKAARERAGK